jgi:hypothetical protein
MVNKISDLKKKQEFKKKGITKENNWAGFFTGIIKNVINLILITIIGSNLLFAINNLSLEKYLPTDPNISPYNVNDVQSAFKAFPYKKVNNANSYFELIQNWFANTVQDNWIFSRNAVKEIFNNLRQLSNPQLFGIPINKYTQHFSYIMDSIIFLLSPIIVIFLMFIVSIVGFIMSMYNGFKQSNNIIYKLLGLMGGYNIGIVTSLLQMLWFIGFIIFKPLIVNFSHLFTSIKKFRKLLMLLFAVSILSASFSNLDNTINIGIVIGFLMLVITPYISKMF